MEDLTPHVVSTGASSGIGAAAAHEMARRGWRVTVVGRDPVRLSQFSGVPGVTALRCDFTLLSDVRDLAKQLEGQLVRLRNQSAQIDSLGRAVFSRIELERDAGPACLEVGMPPVRYLVVARGEGSAAFGVKDKQCLAS